MRDPLIDRRSKREILSEAQNHRCCYCGVRMRDPVRGSVPHTNDCTVEHVIRRVDCGTHDMDNLVAACTRCNAARGGYSAEEWHAIVALKASRPPWRAPKRPLRAVPEAFDNLGSKWAAWEAALNAKLERANTGASP